MTAPLQLEQVSKRFGAVAAVDDVTLELGRGEVLAVVGPSGCGKSTLLRLAAGLATVDRGSVRLGGETVDDGRRALPPERRHVGLVFQDHQLFPHLTVGRNVAFGLGRRAGASGQARVREVLELVGLAGHADRFPHELSGGERQRVALARALAPRPGLLLLDEPFASLDPNLRSQLRADVVAILRAAGTAAVLVTHDQPEALAAGDRVAVMRAGRLAQVGTPAEVFHAPVDRFVATFMGEASFLPATPEAGGWRCALGPVVGGGGPAAAPDAGPGAPVAMVRPDDVVVGPPGDGVPGTVTSAEFRGAYWAHRVVLTGGGEVLALRPHLEPAPVGAPVAVSLRPGHRAVLVG